MRRRLLALGTVVLLTVAGVVAPGSGPLTAYAAEEVYPVPASGSWEVEGRGWGHGIGMSQWGAQGAARQGLTAEQILDHYYPGTVRYDIGQDYPLRVRLLSLAGARLTLGPETGHALVVQDVATGVSATAPAGSRVVISRSAAGFALTSVSGSVSTPLAVGGVTTVVGPVHVSTADGSQVWTYKADGTGARYVGAIRALATSATTLEVVNHVPMEQYLRGVVPRESPSSWAPAALEAQAVAARSYALAVRSAGTADLCDTTACQVYGGSAVSSAGGAVTELHASSTDGAILATARIARYYAGGPAFTQFSSSNGGFSKVGSRPYLVARADPYTGTAPGDTVSSWTSTLTVARVQQSCPSGGTLQSMTLTRDGNGDLGGRVLSARLQCSTGSATVTTPAFGLLSSWWRPTDVGLPFGNLERVEASAGGGVTVVGWLIDPDTTGPVSLRVTVGTSVTVVRAADRRSDVGAAFPAYGSDHGFDLTVPSGPGSTTVCVVALNVARGSDLDLGCTEVVAAAGSPFGAVDEVRAVPGGSGSPTGVVVRGWVVDPDQGTAPTHVAVEVDGVEVARHLAVESRPDVGAALPSYGSLHGYALRVAAAPGAHEVCVLAINLPAAKNPTLGCTTVTVPGGAPTGRIDSLRAAPGAVELAGWMIDPDTADPGYLWVDVDGAGQLIRTSADRPDLAAAFPGYGTLHGYRATLTASVGVHRVCITAIDASSGPNTPLGCGSVTVTSAAPFGAIDSVTGVPGGLRVRGWAIDPETSGPVYVWLGTDGFSGPALAGLIRPDLASAFPAAGGGHGFDVVIPAAAGSRTACVTAVNTGRGGDTSLGCREAQVPGGPPRGMVDEVRAVAGGIEVSGWAVDPDTTAPVYVWVDVSGVGRHLLASAQRADIASAFPGYGAAHGFRAVLAASSGVRDVCVTAVNIATGTNSLLGCARVVVP